MMSIETTLTYLEVFSLWFIQVGRGNAAVGCNNKSTNPGVEGSGRIHSFFSDQVALLKNWLSKLDWNSSACPGSFLRCLM